MDMDMDMEVDMEDPMTTEGAENLYGYNTRKELPSSVQRHDPSSVHYPVVQVPARTESGESHRSQTRRFAAGHAEMQPSAFYSTQNELEAQRNNSHKSKESPMEAAPTCVEEYCSIPRQKRPRRFTKEPQDTPAMNANGNEKKGGR